MEGEMSVRQTPCALAQSKRQPKPHAVVSMSQPRERLASPLLEMNHHHKHEGSVCSECLMMEN
jgi:hypothetical protein